jgi:hypothetical protein
MKLVRFFDLFSSAPPDIDQIREGKDIWALTRLLQHPDFSVQWKAAAALGTLGPDAVDHLLFALGKQGVAGRLGAIEALAEIKDPRAVKPLIDILGTDANNEIRWASAFALGEIGDSTAIEPLYRALKDPDKHVRYGAAISLGRIGWVSESASDTVLSFIALQEWHRIPALGEEGIEPLSRMLHDPDPDIRLSVVDTLGKIRTGEHSRVCDTALRDVDSRVRWKAVLTSVKCAMPLWRIPWSLSKRTRIRKNPEAAALLNFLFLGIGYNYLGKWWGFLVFQIYMTTLLMFTLWPVPAIGTFFFLMFVNVPVAGVVIPLPFSIIFAAHAWDIARNMPDM